MNPVLSKMLGNYIKAQRLVLGKTQIEVAKALGFTSQFLGRIEAGTVAIPKQALTDLIHLLELDKDKLHKIYNYSASWFVDSLYAHKISKLARKVKQRTKSI